MTSGRIITGAYFDSIMLMTLAQQLRALPGIRDAALVMGTPTNRAILDAAGLLLPQFSSAREEDLLAAVAADDAEAARRALSHLDAALRSAGRGIDARSDAPRTIRSAVRRMPGASMAVISVPGKYAADEAYEALANGLHVMVFSDNVSIEDEVALKLRAREKGLLFMGPDCGSALINGAPLGFANVVRRGSVGIVAASGTGLQEVSTIVSNEGAGISQAIGTGGRDVSTAVGGIMFLEALRLLADDSQTGVIVLISKPPDVEVVRRIAALVAEISRPVVASFLGMNALEGPWTHVAGTLEEAGVMAALLAGGEDPAAMAARRALRRREMEAMAASARASLSASQRYLRGLYSGGTLCSEALSIVEPQVGGCDSNVGPSPREPSEVLTSQTHTLLDLGADEFTVGRPHPMIDYSLRCDRLLKEAADPSVAVVLLDVVLGYGAHPDPAGELAPAIREARAEARREGRELAVLCSLTGTEDDPQCRSGVEAALRGAGALVAPTNAAAAYAASCLVRGRAV